MQLFSQALANPDSPAGYCVDLALKGRITLHILQQVLKEIKDVTSRPKLIAKFRLRLDRVTALLENLPRFALLNANGPEIWTYQRDPDDAHYINLALASDAKLIVSRDNDVLALTKGTDTASRQLLAICPDFRVITAPEFIEEFRMLQEVDGQGAKNLPK